MAFQVMGVTAGRKNSNSEILLKEALLVCQEMGAEVRMINLKDSISLTATDVHPAPWECLWENIPDVPWMMQMIKRRLWM